MTPEQPFHFFETSHIAALVATLLVIVGFAWGQKKHPTLTRASEQILGIILLAIWPSNVLFRILGGYADLTNILPLQYCDIAAITGGIALWTHQPRLLEITYFFGLAGTLQGLLTPALTHDFPSPLYFHFFLWHGGIVVAALHGPVSLGWRPARGAPLRMIGLTLLWATVAGIANFFLSANYGFLARKPPNGSIMDPLGPWPWYLLSLIAVAFTVYTLLNLPFHWQRHREKSLCKPL